MRRGTTPTVTLHVDADLTDCEVRVAMRNGGRTAVKTDDQINVVSGKHESTVTMRLTQRDTLALDASYPVEFQIRYKRGDDACATDTAKTTVETILEEGEI